MYLSHRITKNVEKKKPPSHSLYLLTAKLFFNQFSAPTCSQKHTPTKNMKQIFLQPPGQQLHYMLL